MLNLDAPASAIAIWLEGDKWCIRLPDAQLLEIPAGASQRLQQILVGRAKLRPQERPVLNSMALPTQEILDAFREKDDPGFEKETWAERIERAGARQRAKEEFRHAQDIKKKARVAQERRKLKEAEELLQELDL